MTYPPTIAATPDGTSTLGDSTPTHTGHHDQLKAGVDDIVAKLGADPAPASTVTARLSALDATVAGKEASGTAAAAVAAHVAAADPHPTYQTAAEGAASAAAAVATHVAAANPHPEYAPAGADTSIQFNDAGEFKATVGGEPVTYERVPILIEAGAF